MAKFYFLLLLLLFGAVNIYPQVVSGHVYDETNTPLEGAVVYFDGTTISVSTDAKGYFALKGDKSLPAALIANFVGYTSVRIDNPYTGNKLKIILEPDAIEMDAVVVTGKTVFSRKEMLRAFREQFLGQSRAGSSCRIENEDDIRLRFDTSDNILYAEAVRPLRITNNRLKYAITFDLVASEIRYNSKTLNPERISGAFFSGTTFFADVSEEGNALKERKEAYLGSPVHFIKTAVNGDWEEQGFQLFRRSLKVDAGKYFTVKDTLGIKKINILEQSANEMFLLSKEGKRSITTNAGSQRFEILYNKKKQSFLLYSTGSFYANINGLFWPLQELTFGGYMGDLRVGDMLPANYLPNN